LLSTPDMSPCFPSPVSNKLTDEPTRANGMHVGAYALVGSG
jgi:hypothetical protein